LLNARLGPRDLETVCSLGREARTVLQEAVGNMTLTARGIVKVKRVARTIADLAGRDSVQGEDIAEALLLRRLEDRLVVPVPVARATALARAAPRKPTRAPSSDRIAVEIASPAILGPPDDGPGSRLEQESQEP
jgi:hypothetical protein